MATSAVTKPPLSVGKPAMTTLCGPDGPYEVEMPGHGPCPAWCESPEGHSWDGMDDDGRWARPHAGPTTSGQSLHLYGTEYSDGELTFDVFVEEPPFTAHWLRVLAQEYAEAAQWLEAREREEVAQ